MEKKTTFYIESLDAGYTIKEGDKKIAKESAISTREYMLSKFIALIYKFENAGVKNMEINITVEENPPKYL
jgi:hypothetical protein